MSNSAWSCLLGLSLTIVTVVGIGRDLFEPLEVRTVDWRFNRRCPTPEELPRTDPSLVLVEITSECLEKIGRWPWSRDRMADLVSRIASCRPKVIGLDIEFSERDQDPEKDKALARAIASAGNVVLGVELNTSLVYSNQSGGLEPRAVVTDPLPEFKRAAKACGLVNTDPYVENPDGVLRKTPLSMTVDGREMWCLSLAVASLFRGREPTFDSVGRVTLESYRIPTVRGRLVPRPLAAGGVERFWPLPQCAWINFSSLGHTGGLFQTVAASDVLGGQHDAGVLADKMVLVGFAALGVERDQKLTPVGLMPGVEFQANIIRNLRDRDFLVRISPEHQQLLVAAFGIMLSLVFTRIRLSGSLLILAVLVVVYGVVCYQLFARFGWLLDVVPMVSLSVSLLVVIKLFLLATELARKIRNLELLNRCSRHFNATLQLDELKERVLQAFLELADGSGGALAIVRDDTEEIDLTVRGELPERLIGLLGQKSVQNGLFDLWKEGPRFLSGFEIAGRPSVAPDLAHLFDGSIFIPVCHHDRVKGWAFLSGKKLKQETFHRDETDFWLTLSSIGLSAIENGVLYKLATVDALTTLFVRHFFDIQIEKNFGRASRYQEDLALLFTDIDHFKKFNDTYGHQMGDRVLRMVALEMKRCIRSSDYACRYGGEEFAVVLPRADLDGANLLAERIRSRVAALAIPFGDAHLEVTVSVGLTCSSVSSAQSARQFIEEADGALYKAKKSGRNRVCSHERTIEVTDPVKEGRA